MKGPISQSAWFVFSTHSSAKWDLNPSKVNNFGFRASVLLEIEAGFTVVVLEAVPIAVAGMLVETIVVEMLEGAAVVSEPLVFGTTGAFKFDFSFTWTQCLHIYTLFFLISCASLPLSINLVTERETGYSPRISSAFSLDSRVRDMVSWRWEWPI